MVRRSFVAATAFLWVAVFLSYAAGQPLNVGLVPDGISRTTAQDKAPLIALTALGSAVQPYLDRIAQNAEHAREAAQALADVPPASSEAASREELAGSPLCPSS